VVVAGLLDRLPDLRHRHGGRQDPDQAHHGQAAEGLEGACCCWVQLLALVPVLGLAVPLLLLVLPLPLPLPPPPPLTTHPQIGFNTAYCANPGKATLPKVAWTMNVHAVEGSVNDSYRFNPWRGAPPPSPRPAPCPR